MFVPTESGTKENGETENELGGRKNKTKQN